MLIRDRRESRPVERELERKLDLDRLLLHISTQLALGPTDELDREITRSLGRTARFFGLDRACIFQYSEPDNGIDATHVWTRNGLPGADTRQPLPLSDCPFLIKELKRGRFLRIDSLADLPPGATIERQALDRQGIQSTLIIPVYRHHRPTGFVGFDAIRQPAEWTEDVVVAIRLLARLCISALDGQEMASRLTRLAFHDPLTDLPNRKLLHDRLRRALARNRREGRRLVVLLLDIDDFKLANDSLGHAGGDRLLYYLASRLREIAGDYDTLARVGGDEFVIVLENAQTGQAESMARNILARLSEPMKIDGQTMVIHPSIGISDSMGGTLEPEELLQNADVAMYAAKAAGKNRYEYFNASMVQGSDQNLGLRYQLGEAIANDELSILYQPRINLASGAIAGAEALIRWQHPERGLLQPEDFVGFAERSELICALDHWVLQRAGKEAADWFQQQPHFMLSVNLSARELHDPARIDQLVEAIRDCGIPPQRLELELTENVLMRTVRNVSSNLSALKKAAPGLRFAIDDFGSGYSSLNYLRQLPIDTLKMDQAFTRDLGPDAAQGRAIARAIIELGHALNLQVVAEGVSSSDQARCLDALGCEQGQGYYFSSPVSREELTALLDREIQHPPAALRS